MDNGIVSQYITRILSGFFVLSYRDTLYKIVYPDITTKYSAELYSNEEYEKNKYNEWISEDDILYYLINIGLWTQGGDEELKKIEQKIEDLKVELYNSFLNPSKIKVIRKSLDTTRKLYYRLQNIRHSFDHITHKGYCDILKNQYILANSIHNIYGQKIFGDISSIDYVLLNNLSVEINKNTIDIQTFKKLALSDFWRNFWSANKENIFGKPTIEWTDEQKTLVVFSKMYDSIQEHPECPAESIIKDDDMLDGWMIYQKRESEKSKNKNRTDKLLKDKKLGNAKEVFLVANSKEEAENIYSLNDNTSKNIIKERNSIIFKSDKEIKESDLPDVQRDLQIQNNQKFINSRKSK